MRQARPAISASRRYQQANQGTRARHDAFGIQNPDIEDISNSSHMDAMTDEKTMTEADWREKLGDERYHILREGGTERAFTGKLNGEKRDGTYFCAACGSELFESADKYDSGSGWPSFTAPATDDAVEEVRDTSHGMVRTEARCASCGGHLGHVFPDGPPPTGLRYCMNSASLDFEPDEDDAD